MMMKLPLYVLGRQGESSSVWIKQYNQTCTMQKFIKDPKAVIFKARKENDLQIYSFFVLANGGCDLAGPPTDRRTNSSR